MDEVIRIRYPGGYARIHRSIIAYIFSFKFLRKNDSVFIYRLRNECNPLKAPEVFCFGQGKTRRIAGICSINDVIGVIYLSDSRIFQSYLSETVCKVITIGIWLNLNL